MGRPSILTPEMCDQIEARRLPGMATAVLLRRLNDDGVRISRETLDKYLAGHPLAAGPEPTPAQVAAAGESALERDDLADLRSNAASVQRALDEWKPSLGRNPVAARTFNTLANLHANLVKRIVEITPRPEAERDRLAELGVRAREELLKRAREVAKTDNVTELKGRIAAQAITIERLMAKIADQGVRR